MTVTRTTSWAVPTLVGTHSHLDEIFQSRLIQRAPAPATLARVAEPPIAWTFDNRPLTLDDYRATTTRRSWWRTRSFSEGRAV